MYGTAHAGNAAVRQGHHRHLGVLTDVRRGQPRRPRGVRRARRARRALARAARAAVAPTVLALGTVSLITDVSSEMVTAVLPLYLVAGLGLSPLGFGLLDGVYNGFSALVRLVGGHLADRGGGAPQGGRRGRLRPLGAVQAAAAAWCTPCR